MTLKEKLMKKRNKKIGKQILIGILSVAFLTVVMLAVISVMGLKRVQKEIVTSDFEVIAAMADDEVVTVMTSTINWLPYCTNGQSASATSPTQRI